MSRWGAVFAALLLVACGTVKDPTPVLPAAVGGTEAPVADPTSPPGSGYGPAPADGPGTATPTGAEPTPGDATAAIRSPAAATPTGVATARPPAATPTAESTPAPGKPMPSPFEQIPDQVIPAPPDRDPVEVARRLRLQQETIDLTPPPGPPAFAEGDRLQLWVLEDDGGGRLADAVVWRLSAHAVWLFDASATPDSDALDRSVAGFEDQIWPAESALFGDLGGPGLNGDPRITIFHTSLDAGLAGYYSSSDEYPPAVHPYSNGRKIIYVDSTKLAIGSRSYLSVLAHELQHAIHFAADPGEDTWVNEGLSELAIDRAGLTSQTPPSFLRDTNIQLNGWTDGIDSGPHYGASLLFFDYLVQHYGGDGQIRRLMAEPADGLRGVDSYLAGIGSTSTAIDVFRDWVVANYVDADGTPYGYSDRVLGPVSHRYVFDNQTFSGQAAQLGATYYAVRTGTTAVTLDFKGDSTTRLIPVQPQGDGHCWWSNNGDSIDSTLTRQVDLTGVSTATLRYSIWYEIEDGWDYGYVEVSTDGGATWAILPATGSSDRNLHGSAFGPGYTGRSSGWLTEGIDLSPFAGGSVLLRFEYVTDDAVSLRGMCLDGLEIPEIGWADFGESDQGWDHRGFTRVSDLLPQHWIVRAVLIGSGSSVEVSEMAVTPSGEGQLRIDGIGADQRVVIVVSAATPGSTMPAAYTLKLQLERPEAER